MFLCLGLDELSRGWFKTTLKALLLEVVYSGSDFEEGQSGTATITG